LAARRLSWLLAWPKCVCLTRAGGPRHARVLGRGNGFGEMSLLSTVERRADLLAMSRLVLFGL
jgi:hypothetical protein